MTFPVVTRAIETIELTHRIWQEGQTVVLQFTDPDEAQAATRALMAIRGTNNYGQGPARRRPEILRQPETELDSDGTFTEDDQGNWHKVEETLEWKLAKLMAEKRKPEAGPDQGAG